MVGYQNSSKRISKTNYETGKTWVSKTYERILSSDNFSNIFKTTDFVRDQLGRVTNTLETYPGFSSFTGSQVSRTFSLTDAGLIAEMNQIVSAPQSISSNYVYTYDDILRTKETILTINNSATATLSSLEYNNQDLVKTKYLGGVSTGGFLQKVDYQYDAAGKLIQINTPGESECYQGQEICKLVADFKLLIKEVNECTPNLYFIQVGGQSYPVAPALNLLNNSSSQQLEQLITDALEFFGYLGDVSVNSSSDGATIHFIISVSNTNCPGILLNSNLCNIAEFDTEEGSCCTISMPVAGYGAGNPNYPLNTDLFMEKLTFEGLDITKIEYGSDCTQGLMRNEFVYDANHRVKNLFNTVFNSGVISGRYNEEFHYDMIGNIMDLTRNGLISTDPAGIGTFGPIDDLAYVYTNGRLENVTDGITGIAQPKGFRPASSTYTYDANGNIINDDGKDLTITYNVLNLPNKVTNDLDISDNCKIDYTFGGEKIRKRLYIDGTLTEDRLYIGGVEFVNSIPETYYHPDGRIFFKEGVPRFQYKITDHLGNTAVLFEDIDGAGVITMEDPITGIFPEVHQRQFYYSFGMAMEGGWKPQADPEHQYLYNGKELHEDLGLDWYDYGARWYDAAVGRWGQVDPMAESRSWLSSYNYVQNNPIQATDPTGALDEWVEHDGKMEYDNRVLNQDDATALYGEGAIYRPNGYSYTSSSCDDIELGDYGFFKSNGQIKSSPDLAQYSLAYTNPSEALANAQSQISELRGNYAASAGVAGFISGDVVTPELSDGAWPKWAAYAVTGAIAAYYVAKMDREIEGIMSRTGGPLGVQYSLRAMSTRPYICFTCPNSSMNLNVGDVWKYGQTTTIRYTQGELSGLGVTQVNEFYGNQVQIKVMEKVKIYGYFIQNGHLPPGNKIFR